MFDCAIHAAQFADIEVGTVQTCFDRLQNGPKQTSEGKENNGKRKRISFKYIIQEFRLSHLESESNSVC